MKIHLITIGKLKTAHWRDAAGDYTTRLQHYADFRLTELKDSPRSSDPPEKVKQQESQKILQTLSAHAYTVALDKEGSLFSTEKLANFLREKQNYGPQTIEFCIGGPQGFSRDFVQQCDHSLSFSKMTFPHDLARVMLLEQLYRAFSILRGEKYHK